MSSRRQQQYVAVEDDQRALEVEGPHTLTYRTSQQEVLAEPPRGSHWVASPPGSARPAVSTSWTRIAVISLVVALLVILTINILAVLLKIQEGPQPPETEKRSHKLVLFNDTREDDYYWLRDDNRTDPDVLQHLKDETEYAKAMLSDTGRLQDALYKEMRGRIQEDLTSAGTRVGDYYYYWRTEEGKQYHIHCRRKVPKKAQGKAPVLGASMSDEGVGPEEVLLDENVEAAGHDFFMLGAYETSLDDEMLAYSVDTEGGEKYSVHVRHLATQAEVPVAIEGAADDLVWANDNRTMFYVTKDLALDRPNRVWRHTLGSNASHLVYEETDEAFYLSLHRTRCDKYLMISAGSEVTSEVRYLPAHEPEGNWTVLLPREEGVDYYAAARGDAFYVVRRGPDTPNRELLVLPMGGPSSKTAAPTVILPHNASRTIEDVEVSAGHLAVFWRAGGASSAEYFALPGQRGELAAPARPLKHGAALAFDDEAYSLEAYGSGPFGSRLLRYTYETLKTPMQVWEHDMHSGKHQLLWTAPVGGGFDESQYRTLRRWARAEDGTKVPISIVYRRGRGPGEGAAGPLPLLLDAYGAYEYSNDPYFSRNLLSLLDRGFAYAIAHVRGGGEMGRQWYEDGKFLQKKNTFTDVVAVAEYLIKHNYTTAGGLALDGRSAGGLTCGATLNMRPDLFQAAIAGVPFVDVLTTMLDASIPLTTVEFEEWGNPMNETFYWYMKSYSPVDNVHNADYPHMLITGGLHDPRVGYWEPAKYAAKLRDWKTSADSVVLFKCDMGAGHFSKSGRFDRLHETAFEYAFLLKYAAGLTDPSASLLRE